ncbi:MAG: HD domain-containing protein [Acidimicrobiia bacterium]|nr:HD domain-containing protein [Acidimicrobiia bacterium]
MNVSVVAIGLHYRHATPFAGLVPMLWGFADLQIIVFATFGVFLGRMYDEHGMWIPALFVLPILVARQAYAAYLAVQDSREATLEVLIECLEAKDPYTAGHVKRVATFAGYIASELGFSSTRQLRLREAALMHDIGKLIVPNQLLNKPVASLPPSTPASGTTKRSRSSCCRRSRRSRDALAHSPTTGSMDRSKVGSCMSRMRSTR